MELQLVRIGFTPVATEGVLYIDGVFECYTLEDTVRAPGVKVYGETAIPLGRFQVIINHSNAFNRRMPLLLNVPGFDGIRIHNGNKPADTKGCILVGDEQTSPTDGWVGKSVVAYNRLFGKIEAALGRGEKVYINIVDGRNVTGAAAASVRPVT